MVKYALVHGSYYDIESLARVNTAIKKYGKNEEYTFIFTGGTGSLENIVNEKIKEFVQEKWPISVAEFMKEYAAKQGIKPENIITENNSYNTLESAVKTKDLIKNAESTNIITTSWHAPRACTTFKLQTPRAKISYTPSGATQGYTKTMKPLMEGIGVIREFYRKIKSELTK